MVSLPDKRAGSSSVGLTAAFWAEGVGSTCEDQRLMGLEKGWRQGGFTGRVLAVSGTSWSYPGLVAPCSLFYAATLMSYPLGRTYKSVQREGHLGVIFMAPFGSLRNHKSRNNDFSLYPPEKHISKG